MRRISQPLITFALLSLGFAQSSSTVSGKVVTAGGRPLVGATVNISSSDSKFAVRKTTDKNGEYRVSGLPTGWYRLEIEFPRFDYKPIVTTLLVSSHGTTVKTVMPRRKDVGLGCTEKDKTCF